MANKYLVLGAGAFTLAAAKISDSDGGAGGASMPVTGDTLYITALSGCNSATDITIPALFLAKIVATQSSYIQIKSSVLGTAVVITPDSADASSPENIDFMDIASTTNLNLAPTRVGNCGGNSNITFPTAVAQHWITAAGGNFSGNNWSITTGGAANGRVPLAGIDTMYFDLEMQSAKTITWDIPRCGKSVYFDAADGFAGLSWTGTATTVTRSRVLNLYGSLILKSGSTLTGNYDLYLRGRGNYTLNNAGLDMYGIVIYCPNGTYTGILTSVAVGSGHGFGIYNGGLVCNSQIFTVANFYTYGTGEHSVDITNSTITLTDTAVNPIKWSILTTGLTSFTSTDSTIILTNSGTSAQTFAGGGLTYNNVKVAGAGNYPMTVTGNNSFNTFTVDRSVASKSLVATGTTQTVSNFVAETSSTRTVTITGGTWTKTGGGTIDLDYMTVIASAATPASTWYAGAPPHSTNGYNNSGWIFGRVNAIVSIQGGTARRIGLSTDTKPTGLNPGSRFWESNTDKYYITNDGTNWIPLRGKNYDSNVRNLYR